MVKRKKRNLNYLVVWLFDDIDSLIETFLHVNSSGREKKFFQTFLIFSLSNGRFFESIPFNHERSSFNQLFLNFFFSIKLRSMIPKSLTGKLDLKFLNLFLYWYFCIERVVNLKKIERIERIIEYMSSSGVRSPWKILFKLCTFHSTNRQRSMTRTLRSKICHRRGNWPINLWGNRHVCLLEQTTIIHIYIYISVKIVVRVREIFVRFNKKNDCFVSPFCTF